jgi:hypothetical protein
LLFFVNPQQSYYIQQPMFLFDKVFFCKFLGYPGGLIEYISLFFSQFYYYSLIGSLIITGTVLAVWLLTDKIVKFYKFNRFTIVLNLAPSAAILYLHGFSDGIFTTSLILLCTLLLFFYYLKISGNAIYVRLVVYLFFSLIAFYGIGGSGLLLFMALCLFNEIATFKEKRSLSVIPAILLSGVFPYLAARFQFPITPGQSYFHFLTPHRFFQPRLVLYILYIYYPLLVFFCNIFPKEPQTKDVKRRAIVISFSIQVVFIGVLTFLSINYSTGSNEQFSNKIKYLAYKGEWQKILDLTKKHYSDDRLVNFNINKALYYTERLPYDLFQYPNFWGQHALFLGSYIFSYITMDNSELYFALGHIRAARQWAYETQTVSEYSPRVLQMLALTNIIERDYDAAYSMLRILDKSFIYKKWTHYYLNGIKDTTIFESDSLIQEKRRSMPSDVHFMDGRKVEVDLLALLKKNPKNKMAFEYLMAYLILSDQIEKLNITDEINSLKQLDYKEIPQTYQEALMVYCARKSPDSLESALGTYKMNPQLLNRYVDYLDILSKYNMDRMTAREELYYKYGMTYWYYQQYVSPTINNKEFMEKMFKQ